MNKEIEFIENAKQKIANYAAIITKIRSELEGDVQHSRVDLDKLSEFIHEVDNLKSIISNSDPEIKSQLRSNIVILHSALQGLRRSLSIYYNNMLNQLSKIKEMANANLAYVKSQE